MNLAGQLYLVILLFISLRDGVSQESREIPQKYTSHPNWKLLNVLDVCGRPARTFTKKIVGGENAKLGQFPWMAYLFYSFQPRLGCGGSIINHRYIMTAAHCGRYLRSVRLGEYEYKDETHSTSDCVANECAPPAQDYKIEEIMCHYWSKNSIHDDICLIRLDRDIQFNNFVRPVCLPFYTHLQDKYFEEKYMEVAGWGTVNKTLSYPSTLQVVKVPVMNKRSCAELWGETGEVIIVETQMCTRVDGGLQREGLACVKDSGGPLMERLIVGQASKYFQFGIISAGDRRCDEIHFAKELKPAIYTRVVSYLEWILDNIHE